MADSKWGGIAEGVRWNKKYSTWTATIKVQKVKHLGSFKDEIDAAKAYDAAALEYFGEFAFLNFPKEKPCQTI